jgi:hypothetical protein
MSEELNVMSPGVFARRVQSFLRTLTHSDSLELDQNLIGALYDAYVNRSNPNESFEEFMARILNFGPEQLPEAMPIDDVYNHLAEFNYLMRQGDVGFPFHEYEHEQVNPSQLFDFVSQPNDATGFGDTIDLNAYYDVALRSCESVLQSCESVLQSCAIALQNGESVLQSCESASQSYGSASQNYEAALQSCESALQNYESVLQSNDDTSSQGNDEIVGNDTFLQSSDSFSQGSDDIDDTFSQSNGEAVDDVAPSQSDDTSSQGNGEVVGDVAPSQSDDASSRSNDTHLQGMPYDYSTNVGGDMNTPLLNRTPLTDNGNDEPCCNCCNVL